MVTASLPGRLGIEWGDDCRRLLQDEIDKWVLSTSKITHRLSLIFNRFLLHLLNFGKKLPPFNDSLFTGMAMHGMKGNDKMSKQDYALLIMTVPGGFWLE